CVTVGCTTLGASMPGKNPSPLEPRGEPLRAEGPMRWGLSAERQWCRSFTKGQVAMYRKFILVGASLAALVVPSAAMAAGSTYQGYPINNSPAAHDWQAGDS